MGKGSADGIKYIYLSIFTVYLADFTRIKVSIILRNTSYLVI